VLASVPARVMRSTRCGIEIAASYVAGLTDRSVNASRINWTTAPVAFRATSVGRKHPLLFTHAECHAVTDGLGKSFAASTGVRSGGPVGDEKDKMSAIGP
jgi:hypothetical protein